MDHQSLGLGRKNISSTQTNCPHSSGKMQDSTKEEEQMKVAESLSSRADGGPREVEEEEKTLEPEIVESNEGVKAHRVPVIVYPKKTKRNMSEKRTAKDEPSSSKRTKKHIYPVSSSFRPNQPKKLGGITNDMDDEPLDLSKNSASSTKETGFVSEKQHVAEKEDMRILPEIRNETVVAEFSSAAGKNRKKSLQKRKKSFRSPKMTKINQNLESKDMITESGEHFKRKRNEKNSTKSKAKRHRGSDPASSRMSEDKSRLPADSDYSGAASSDHFSCRPSTSESSSYDSTANQKPSTNSNSVSRFVCEHCGKGFQYNSKLQRHYRTHTGEKPFGCKSCNQRFAEKSHLQEHTIRLHAKERPYPCEECEKSFATQNDLTQHSKRHTEEKPFSCKKCEKSFITKSEFTRHSKSHSGEKHFCTECKKSFTTKDHLRRHSNRHTGEKSFPCKICEKSFPTSDDLTRHLRIHTEEKPYVCKICGKAYTQKHNLDSHEKTHE